MQNIYVFCYFYYCYDQFPWKIILFLFFLMGNIIGDTPTKFLNENSGRARVFITASQMLCALEFILLSQIEAVQGKNKTHTLLLTSL